MRDIITKKATLTAFYPSFGLKFPHFSEENSILQSFGYDNTDEYGTRIYHKEQSDASNTKTGSYGYRDEYGIFRRVNYVADANGFRATIDTNEPGTAAGRSADAVFNAKPVAAPVRANFGYDNTDEFGTRIYHTEQSDASNTKTGSYGYRDEYGIFRRVNYVADANGFRATIDTNEPGTAPGRSADAVFNAKPVAAPVRAKSAASAPIAAYLFGPVYGGKYSVPGARSPWARRSSRFLR
ncbi:hypothetical protein HPB48_022977 [Haemaphysalis longicornis]|uniref:Cuticle protein n=1 Tax=Haemaphysalis longicornis TaxID=44386 RepID=A0A9J6G8H1_HAELO|nr:hypothetical protein HPB48_022977 [Haemaphysalis longicornis]